MNYKKTYIVFLFICSVCRYSLSVSAQTEVPSKLQAADFITSVFESSISFKMNFFDLQLLHLQYDSDRKQRRPVPYIVLDPQFGAHDGIGKSFINLPITAGISQKLPLQSSLSVRITQPFSINPAEKSISYGFSAAVSVSSNAAFFMPALADSYREQEHTYTDNLLRQFGRQYETATKSAKKEYLMNISNYLYYRKLSAVYGQRSTLLEAKSKEDSDLYKLGRITSLEFSEREKQRIQIFSAHMQALQQTFLYETELILQEIPVESISFSFEEWIDLLQSITIGYDIRNQSRKDLQLVQKNISWKNTLEKYIQELPTINCTYTMKPISVAAHSPAAFWEHLSAVEWNLSFSARIPLAPWDAGYAVETAILLEREKRRVDLLQLQKETKNEIILRQKKLNLLSVLEEKNRRQYEQESERQNLYEQLRKTGRMSEMDIQLQKTETQEAFVQWYFSKLNRIEHILSFY